MWNGYYYKILDAHTPPLLWAPRWIEANGYPTLSDYVQVPSNRSITLSGIYTIPVDSIISSAWVMTTAASNSAGSLFQKLFEVFVNEKEYLQPQLTSLLLSRQFFFDIADPQYAWILESTTPIQVLTVRTTTGTALIKQAKSDLDLFYSGDWRWKQEDNNILIYGLDIQQLTDTVSGSWHFIDSTNLTSTGSYLYVEHPITKNWFPVHPSKIRSDGFVNFYYDGSMRFRGHFPTAAKALSSLLVYADGKQYYANRISIVNSLDEKSLYFNLSRRYSESNEDFGNTILRTSWFSGQSIRKLRSAISANLRTGEIFTLSASASSFTLPATATGVAIKNMNPWVYSYENLTVPVSGNSTTFYTIYASGEIGCGYVRGIKTDFTSVSGVLSFNTYIDNSIDRPLIHWKLPLYTVSGSTLFLAENLPHEIPDLIIFCPSKVDVSLASLASLKKSFQRTFPRLRWSRYQIEKEILTGLAEFDF